MHETEALSHNSSPDSPSIRMEEKAYSHLRSLAEQGSLFAILDACDNSAVPAIVNQLGESRGASLYRGAAQEELWQIAPYIVHVDASFLDKIVGILWEEMWGIFFTSTENLATLRRHFRRFLTVQYPNGEKVLFRFYDPRVLTLFLSSCNVNELNDFFGPVLSFGVNHGLDSEDDEGDEDEEDTDPMAAYRVVMLRRSNTHTHSALHPQTPPLDAVAKTGDSPLLMNTHQVETVQALDEPGLLPFSSSSPSPHSTSLFFTFRQEQLDYFEQVALWKFLDKAALHLRIEFPDQWGDSEEEDLTDFVYAGLEDARERGIQDEIDVIHYLELMTILGDDFAEDPRNLDVLRLFCEPEWRDDWLRARQYFVALKEYRDEQETQETQKAQAQTTQNSEETKEAHKAQSPKTPFDEPW